AMCFDHDGYADAYTDTVRKARKPHACDECYEKSIAAGQLYFATSGIFEGQPFNGHYCGACELTRFRIWLHELGEGCFGNDAWCPLGELHEYCGETDFEMSTAEEGQKFLS